MTPKPQSISSELLPCPLPSCGSDAEIGRAFGDPYYVHSIECSECGVCLSVTSTSDSPPQSMFDLWNTRSGRLSPAGDVVGALRSLLAAIKILLPVEDTSSLEFGEREQIHKAIEESEAALHGQGDGWIAVEERLPEIGERVWVSQLINRGMQSEYRRYFDAIRSDTDPSVPPEELAMPWWWADFDDISESHAGITHWQPLPPAPTPSGQPNSAGGEDNRG
jgi:hypothetical protein